MQYQAPSTAELSANITAQLQASLGQTIPFLPKAFLTVLAKVLAGVLVLLHKYAGFLLLQMFVPYASTKEVTVNGQTLIPLVEWGRLLGIGDPLAASRAILDVEVPVTNQTGALGSGAQLVRKSTGVVYVTTAPVDLDAATVTVRVRASSDQDDNGGVGVQGNLQIGDVLEFASPLPNISREAEVSSVVVTAEDGESWDNYRARVLERAQARPQGGAYADYRLWAREVPGIVAAYPYSGAPGEVDVYVEASVASSGNNDGIPTQAQLDAVSASIEADEDGTPNRRPVNALVNVHAISRLPFSVEVSSVTGPSNLQADIQEALTAYYLEREPYILGLSVLPRKDRVLEASLIGLIDQVVQNNGGTVGSIKQYRGLTPTPSYTLGNGEKAKLVEVTFP